MEAKEVQILIDSSIILFDEEHEKFPGIIKQFSLTEREGDKPYRMTALISEREAGKPEKVLNEWTFAVSEEDIDFLKLQRQVELTRLVTMGDHDLSIVYRGVVVSALLDKN